MWPCRKESITKLLR